MVREAKSEITRQVEQRWGAAPVSLSPVSGGDINEAFRLELRDGRTLFAKYNARPLAGSFESEALGLTLLRETALACAVPGPSLVVPDALHHFEHGLITNWLDFKGGGLGADFGRALARLHLASPPGENGAAASEADGRERPSYGLGRPIPVAIGTLPQSESKRTDWVEFFIHERLLAQLELPAARRLVDAALRRSFDTLFNRMPELLPPTPRPSLLHGDLWGGNAAQTAEGPCIYDPAVSIGHAEVDLAMMDLFGGFSPSVWAGYEECLPAEPGRKDRLDLYQLYPLLVHVNLFGSGYLGGVRSRLAHFA